MKKGKKRIIIFGIIVLCVIVCAGIYFLTKKEPIKLTSENIFDYINVEIEYSNARSETSPSFGYNYFQTNYCDAEITITPKQDYYEFKDVRFVIIGNGYGWSDDVYHIELDTTGNYNDTKEISNKTMQTEGYYVDRGDKPSNSTEENLNTRDFEGECIVFI